MQRANKPVENDVLADLSSQLQTLLDEVAHLKAQNQTTQDLQVEMVNFLGLWRQNSEAMNMAVVEEANQIRTADKAALTQLRDDIRRQADRQYGELIQQLRLIKQAANETQKKIATPVNRVRCVFLVHVIEAWDALIDVYQAMRNDARFEPLVATINRRFPGEAGYGGEAETSQALTAAGIPHIRLGMGNSYEALDILRGVMPDVVFRQSHWDDDIPPAFSTSELAFTRLCSVPYGTSIVQRFGIHEAVSSEVSHLAFDQPYHRQAWRVFCETEITRDYFQSFAHSNPNKFILSGYPKLERLLRGADNPHWPIANSKPGAFRVIWAPHHSVGRNWLGFGVFHQMFREMLNWARSSPDIEFVLKPHPALARMAVSEGNVPREECDAFFAEWSALPNCCVAHGQYAELFAASDLMITDGLSFLTEYHLFRKPLIFFDSREHVPFNRLGQMAADSAHTVTNFETMKAAVLDYQKGMAWPLEKEREALLSMLFPADKPAVEVILGEIYKEICGVEVAA